MVGTTATRVSPSTSSIDLADETWADKGQEREVDVEEEGKSRPAPVKQGLSRSESMKKAGTKALDHYKEHRYKYIACKVVIALAIGLGVGLGIAYAVYSKYYGGLSLTQKKAAVLGSEMKLSLIHI